MIKLNNYKPTFTLTVIFSIISLTSIGQNEKITRYFDSDWKKTSRDSAVYFTEIIKENDFYSYTSYWVESKRLNCKSAYLDTLSRKPVGQLIRYYENGQTEDSTIFYENGILKETYHYHQNGKLAVDYTYNLKTKKDITKAYDEDGNPIKNFIYMQESKFQNDVSDWQNYLLRNLNEKVAERNGAPAGTYEVVVQFIIGKDGLVSDVFALTKRGYGMEEELIRVVKNSPRWHPAVYMAKPAKSYKKQAIRVVAGGN
ncbi:MAG TPA: hypothetical protein VKA49_20945 [Flavitalea sp.]|nr:hypothetical protein [Flavitalea sp.]